LKKQSVANSASPKPLENLTFFLDRQLGRHKMAAILRAADLQVEIHDDHFAQDATDEEWLRVVGEKKWIVVTRDERIRYRAAAREVIRRAKVQMFVLVAHGSLHRNVGRDFFESATEHSSRRSGAESAVYREDLARWESCRDRLTFASRSIAAFFYCF
jgi:hypothetical protein